MEPPNSGGGTGYLALQAAGALIDSWASPFLGLKKPRHMSRAAVVLLVFGMKISMFTLIALELLQTNCLSMVSVCVEQLCVLLFV